MNRLNVSTASATGNPRNKVSLKPGRSLMDWIRLTNSSADLSGTGNRMRDISLEELAQHNKQNDAWLAIRGVVYNVTSYFEFHPGGEEELMRGVGIDATDLFDQVHKWVNYESMLKKCIVGRLKSDALLPAKRLTVRKTAADNGFQTPPLPAPSLSAPGVTTDWIQGMNIVTIILYTRQKGLDSRRLSSSLDAETRLFRIRVLSDDWRRCYDYQIRLAEAVDSSYNVTVSSTTGKIELVFRKKQPALHWQKMGTDFESTNQGFLPLNQAPPFFRRAVLSRKTRVNHNVFLFTLTFPSGQTFYVPIGWHVQLKLSLEDGSELIRSYTPVPDDLSSCKATDCPSSDESSLKLHFLIKIYPDGPFTSVLDRLVDGSLIEVSDPIGNFEHSQLEDKNVVAIAAGTGITPMIRLIIEALRSQRNVWLLFFNRTQQDIIWREEFRQLELKYPDKFKIWNVLSEPDDEWSGLRGKVSKSILATTIYPEDRSNSVCVCGPSSFTLETLRLLDSAEFIKETVYAFSG